MILDCVGYQPTLILHPQQTSHPSYTEDELRHVYVNRGKGVDAHNRKQTASGGDHISTRRKCKL